MIVGINPGPGAPIQLGYFMHSTDAGETWALQATGNNFAPVNDVTYDPNNENVAFVARDLPPVLVPALDGYRGSRIDSLILWFNL
jgi:hypothetical protein